MTYEISAVSREQQGTGASRRLRKAGQLPGIVFGGSKEPKAISLDHNTLYYKLQEEAFHTNLVKLTVDGQTEQVLVRNVQYHPFRQQVLHVDFQRVDDSTKVEVKIPLHFKNGENAPGVKLQGGRISYVLNEVLVRCIATKIPDFIEVDLAHLDAAHGSVHLSDLKLPEGVELVSLIRGENLSVANLNGAKAGE